jgi:PAS domain S-box-containing protein
LGKPVDHSSEIVSNLRDAPGESERRLLALLDGVGEPFYAIDRDWRLTYVNAVAASHFGATPTAMLGRLLWEAVPNSWATALGARFRAVMEGGRLDTFEAPSIVTQGLILEFRLFPTPEGMGVTFRDVTERRKIERILMQREAELARVQRIGRVAGVDVDLVDGFHNRRSPEYLRLHGLPPEAHDEPHEAWVRRVHPDDRERVERGFIEAVESGATEYEAEYRIVRPSDGELRWISAKAEIERDAQGRALRLVGAHIDVTERKRAEEHLLLLIHELNHRVKNTLATVQSIASQTLRNARSLDEARAAFEERLMALSRAHDVLTRENWEGASLHEIVLQALSPYRARGEDRLYVHGSFVRLDPRMALALAMALQELATNAVKYGALSNAQGSIEIGWEVEADADGRRLSLTWVERGGPPVTPPQRRGFGSRLIERSLVQDLDGEATLSFESAGLVCRVSAPLM